MRQYFDLVESEDFIIEIGDKNRDYMRFKDARTFAEIGNSFANIHDYVLQIGGAWIPA